MKRQDAGGLMRSYGKVYSQFWTSEDIQCLSEDGRTLALYLMTCEHGNMLGCFRLTNAYAADDLKWSIERVSKGFDDLIAKGYAYRCERTFWVLIYRHLKWNQFENPNVGIAAGKLFDTLGAPFDVKALLVKALREFSETFPVKKLEVFETLSIPFANPFDTSSKTVAVAVALTVTEAVAPTVANSDVGQEPPDALKTIFEYWQERMASPRSVLDSKRRSLIANALKNYEPAAICKAIRGCSKTPHNMGQNKQKTKYNGLNLILRDAEHIDYFINLDDSQARPSDETIEQMNARLTAEFLGDEQTDDDTIEMEA
jgi:hypothetical protein